MKVWLQSQCVPRLGQSRFTNKACGGRFIFRQISQSSDFSASVSRPNGVELMAPDKAKGGRPCIKTGKPSRRPTYTRESRAMGDSIFRSDRASSVDGSRYALWRMLDTGLAFHRVGSDWKNERIGTFRKACVFAFVTSVAVEEEVQARKLCARLKDARYAQIYQSLDEQAHALYLFGRCELERDSDEIWSRAFGCYMLSIAAGLGQLDAALLLHQLEKFDPRRSLQIEQRAIIAKAASMKVDWRAMVAHSEYLMSKGRGRVGKAPANKSDFDRCVELLTEAMSLTGPLSDPMIEREPPPEGCIDAETLETFDPPYQTLLNLLASKASPRNLPKDLTETFELAAKTGAIDYQDPEVASEYATYHLNKGRQRDAEWVKCMEVVGMSGDPEACFELAKYLFERDGWYPTTAEVVLDEIDRKWREDREKVQDHELKSVSLTDKEKHDMIMARKNKELLATQEGAQWMLAAARLQIDSATKMLNRYCIVAGLLRQNGFTEEGLSVLLDGREELKNCIGNPKEIAQALHNANEFIEHWDSRPVHQLLTPKDIDPILNPSMRK